MLFGTPYYKKIYPQDIPGKENSCSMAPRFVTHSHKTVQQEWMATVPPQTVEHYLQVVQGHCKDCEVKHFPILHWNSNERNHIRIMFLLSRASTLQWTVLSSSSPTWNNRSVPRSLAEDFTQLLWLDDATATESSGSGVRCPSTHSSHHQNSWTGQ